MAGDGADMNGTIPVIDLFAGCGGFGEGFSALHRERGFPFDVRLHVEKEPAPVRTLELRTFYHQFRGTRVPDAYYEYVSGKIDRDELFSRHPREAEEAKRRCLALEIGDSSATADLISNHIEQAVAGAERWALIGGPPCQAYSVIGRVRNQSLDKYDPDKDIRLRLYQEYTRIVAKHWPACFIMENVRGLLSAHHAGQSIFEQITAALREPARLCDTRNDANGRCHTYRLYSVTSSCTEPVPGDFVVKAEEYGVPQARHRVFILGVRDDIHAEPEPLSSVPEAVSAGAVLDGLPSVRSGVSSQDSREQWLKAVHRIAEQPWWTEIPADVQHRINEVLAGLETTVYTRGNARYFDGMATSDYRPDWFEDGRLAGTLNHQARTHREDDLWRYLFASCIMEDSNRPPLRIRDFPVGLRPKHKSASDAVDKDSFTDRFSVLHKDTPSRTVVSHIRKDGHYYIHYDPSQCRSLTVREAARLQTFPDNYLFEGSRTDQYGQVGNAVPPLLSLQVADRVASLLERG